MTTLISLLLGYLAYDKEKAIYAKLRNSKFEAESEATIANTNRELAKGLSKDYVYFSRNDFALDFLECYWDGFSIVGDLTEEEWEEAQDEIIWKEAAKQFISNKNKVIAAIRQ